MKKIFSIIRNDQIIDSGWKFIMKFKIDTRIESVILKFASSV